MNIIQYFVYRVLMKLKKIFCQNNVGLFVYKVIKMKKLRFLCPICGYNGPFFDLHTNYAPRKHAICPVCGSYERHRLQYLVVQEIAKVYNLKNMRILHCAPEPYFQQLFRKIFGQYTAVDLYMKQVDVKVNLTKLPFKNRSFDVVFASHVLEYIKEDIIALSEVSRVLTPDGIAILPVPIVSRKTIEYPEPNPHESGGHIRVPGPNYYDKYLKYFSRIEKFDSNSFPQKYQTFIYEDRTKWPKTMPLRPTMEGDKHLDIVPVCFKRGVVE